MDNKGTSFWYRNGLSLVLLALFIVSFTGQILTGWYEYNGERIEQGQHEQPLSSYFTTGHFIESTFENWESEFLQMGIYVLLTVFLRQLGSSESKSLHEKEEVDREPDPKKKDAPWPVKKGGVMLALYKNSLSLAFIILFLASFVLHTYGSLNDFNEEKIRKGEHIISMGKYLGHSRLWFESFQNWQSEFIAVLSIVYLSVYLRQKGSPESKPVDASNTETGTE